MNQFQDRVVVVTGASSGIGAAAVTRFREAGAHVIGVDRAESSVADDHVVGDLSTRDGLEAVVAELARRVEQDGGRPIDVLVNNAGVAATLRWRTVLGVNALATRDLPRLLMPYLHADPVVVTTASMAGFMWMQNYGLIRRFLDTESWDEALDLVKDHPDLDTACYNLSKEIAIVNAGDLAVNGKHLNLRSNSVSPGPVDTALLPDFVSTMGEENVNGTAMWAGRHATADEVAQAIVFLASPEASWVNGVDLPVDGGLNAMVFRSYIAPMLAGGAA